MSVSKDMDPSRRPIPPLKIVKSDSDSAVAIGPKHPSTRFHSQFTPPATPHAIKEEEQQEKEGQDNTMDSRPEPPKVVFHNYLRAFYPFHPTGDVSPSTVTLPLDQGDIILVHSVHINGWADGTLLDTGARGWLPTNYCEAYDQLPMRPLLRALTDFWDIIRGGCGSSLKEFGNQDLMRGLIAGVRFLLVSQTKTKQKKKKEEETTNKIWSVLTIKRKNRNASQENRLWSNNMMAYAGPEKGSYLTCHL